MARPMVTGIYEILNKVNGKVYIGSSSRDVHTRWDKHHSLLRKGIHSCTPLQNSWNKYGEDAFEFNLLYPCAPDDAIYYEQLFFDNINNKYNVGGVAYNGFSGRKHTDEARQRMKVSRNNRPPTSDITKLRMSASHVGKKHSPEWVQNCVLARKGYRVSDETKEKIRQAQLGVPESEETKLKLSLMRRGEKNINSKLSNNDVKIIRWLYPTFGYTVAYISRLYGVSWTTIDRVIKHISWSSIQ